MAEWLADTEEFSVFDDSLKGDGERDEELALESPSHLCTSDAGARGGVSCCHFGITD